MSVQLPSARRDDHLLKLTLFGKGIQRRIQGLGLDIEGLGFGRAEGQGHWQAYDPTADQPGEPALPPASNGPLPIYRAISRPVIAHGLKKTVNVDLNH